MQKIIGTLVPMSALFSREDSENDKGTFSSGLIFLDWLKKTHQSAWQLLPLYETQLASGSGTERASSPYKSYGIGFDPKYLPMKYATTSPTEQEKNDFITDNREWIHDYTLFCALRDYFHTDDWRNWDSDLKNREEKAIARWTSKLIKKITDHIIVQWRLHRSYTELKNKAKKLDISLNGDLPFYVSVQSPLVWAHQEVFDLQKNGSMQYVSGVPNSPPSFFGRQVWGHPLYNWESKENWGKIVAFWEMRLSYLSRYFDLIRFDYAKAFFDYGAMDVENILNDGYRKGPGSEVFENLIKFSKRCGLSVFAEDTGNKIKEIRKSLKVLKNPGIKIFRFALDEKKDKIVGEYADVAHYPTLTVAYTTTHDTETLLGYLYNLTLEQKRRLAAAAGVVCDFDTKAFAKRLRGAVLASPAGVVIVPIQDWLLITDRINIPGTELSTRDPNWHFRLKIPIEDLPTHF